jgi:hypothetical protein
VSDVPLDPGTRVSRLIHRIPAVLLALTVAVPCFAQEGASPTTSGLELLNGRFDVVLSAADPRTGLTTTGTPHALGDGTGYFSLPDFTNRPSFPEITLKMVDATAAGPPFGGAFWFFWSSLTDVEYVLTVTDLQTGRVRTYGSAGSPAFCGGADTNAFPP